MAIEQRIINNSLTGICVGGGNFLTESYPTNFHTFVKRKVLTTKDSIENYREVTEAEKTALEKSDAAWVEPPQCFIDLWNQVTGNGRWGRYNPATGFFELNGILDIPYKEALAIYSIYNGEYRSSYANLNAQQYPELRVRTVLPLKQWINIIDAFRAFSFNSAIEVINLVSTRDDLWHASAFSITNCTSLRKVIGNGLYVAAEKFESDNCPKLEELLLAPTNSTRPYKLGDSPLLGLSSFRFMVQKAVNTAPVTIKVHPEVWAKLTDADNADWSALMEAAAQKSISFVSA